MCVPIPEGHAHLHQTLPNIVSREKPEPGLHSLSVFLCFLHGIHCHIANDGDKPCQPSNSSNRDLRSTAVVEHSRQKIGERESTDAVTKGKCERGEEGLFVSDKYRSIFSVEEEDDHDAESEAKVERKIPEVGCNPVCRKRHAADQLQMLGLGNSFSNEENNEGSGNVAEWLNYPMVKYFREGKVTRILGGEKRMTP